MKTLNQLLLAFALALVAIPASAVDLTKGGTTRWQGMQGTPSVAQIIVDCTESNLATTNTAHTIFNIPARTIVHGVSLEVIEPENHLQTVSIGDADNDSAFLYRVNGNSDGSIYSSALGFGAKRIMALTFGDVDTAASQSSAAWGTDLGADVGGAVKGHVMPSAYRIIGSSLYGNATQTTGTVTVVPTIDGTAKTAVQCVMRAGESSTYTLTHSLATVGSAGDVVGVKVTTSSTLNPTTIDYMATVFVEVDQDNATAAALGYGGGRYYPTGGTITLKFPTGRAVNSILRIRATATQF